MNPSALPSFLAPLAPALRSFHKICEKCEITPSQAALLWIRREYPDSFPIFGAEAPFQVQQNLAPEIWRRKWPAEFFEELGKCLSPQERKLLNPSLWNK